MGDRELSPWLKLLAKSQVKSTQEMQRYMAKKQRQAWRENEFQRQNFFFKRVGWLF